MAEVRSPLQGSVVRVVATPGTAVEASSPVVIVESMKMEYVVEAGVAGTIGKVAVTPGDAVRSGDVLALVDEAPTAPAPPTPEEPATAPTPAAAPTARADLAEVVDRHAAGLDDARPEAVARRRATGQRTTRENVADLLDPGSFVEYGPLTVAAQRRRRSIEDLIARTPADGLVAGVGTVDGRATAVLSYDYTVLAGTQGYQNHRKKDRLFDVIGRGRTARRHRCARRVGPRLPGVQPVGRAQRLGAAGGHHVGAVLRRQRRHPRLLRRGVRPRGDRAAGCAGGQRRGRRRRGRRGRGGGGSQALPVVLRRTGHPG